MAKQVVLLKMRAAKKRPRAWDVSLRPSHEKKRPSHEKMEAAFFTKQLVLVFPFANGHSLLATRCLSGFFLKKTEKRICKALIMNVGVGSVA